MGDINLVWVNVLKKHFLDIPTYYEGSKDRLKDKAVERCYEALLAVSTPEQFRQWRLMMDDFGLAFTNMDAPVKYENPMGILDDVAEGVPEDALKAFLEWKKTINPKKLIEIRKKDAEIVAILRKAVERPEDMSIYIFPCGNRWAAIDKDAERIFEAFGWQTGSVWDGENIVSWIFIEKTGLEVLKASGYDVRIMDFGEFDIFYYFFEEDVVASVQQMVDHERMMKKQVRNAQRQMMHLSPYTAPRGGFAELMEADIVIDGDRLLGALPDGRLVMLADGKNWRFDELTQPMVEQMGNFLDKT